MARLAVRLIVEDGLAYRNASWHLGRDHRVFVPFATIQNFTPKRGNTHTWRTTQATRVANGMSNSMIFGS